MTETRYLTGYNGTTRTRAEFIAWLKGQKIEPELERRTLAIIDASHVAGRPLGIGSAKRSKVAADNLFLSRYALLPAWVPGAVKFPQGAGGRWYKLRKGQSPAMPSDRTYHVRMTPQSATDPDADGLYCLAIDFIGDLGFLASNALAFGLVQFGAINGEPWHGQGPEYPQARSRYVYRSSYDPLPVIKLPGIPPAQPQPVRVIAPLPTLKQRSRLGGKNDSVQVRALQLQCNFWGWRDALNRTLIVDGEFAAKTDQAVRAMQRALHCTVDGVYGPATAKAFQSHLDAMAAMASKKG